MKRRNFFLLGLSLACAFFGSLELAFFGFKRRARKMRFYAEFRAATKPHRDFMVPIIHVRKVP